MSFPNLRVRQRSAIALAAALAVYCAGGIARASTPEVRFGESEVSAIGVTPGGQVVLWWLAQGVDGYSRWHSRLAEVVVDEDGDGAVTLALERRVTERSLWAVVDVASGAYELASPLAGPLREVEAPRGLAGALADRGDLDEERRRIEVLLVRPGAGAEGGAWTGGADDGGTADGDGQRDGRTRARLERLEPVAVDGAPAPRAFQRGDVVIVGDAEELVFWVARVGDDADAEAAP